MDFKTKKLAETWDMLKTINLLPTKDYIECKRIEQFISDLIDEMETNLFLKDIVTKTRIDTLKKVIELKICDMDGMTGGVILPSDIIDKAKSLWDIDLTNLN